MQQALDYFVAKNLMLSMDGRYLSLALPQNTNFELQLGPQRANVAATAPENFVLAVDLVRPPAVHSSEGGD